MMPMLEQDWGELRRLLRLAQEGLLGTPEEQKLRVILLKTTRDAFRMDLGEVLHHGFVMVGLDALRRDIEKAAAA
jgi:hypothetical protein